MTHIFDGYVIFTTADGEHGATVRDCLECGCLVPGGPSRCKRCAAALSEDAHREPLTMPPIWDGLLECWRWREAAGLLHMTNDEPSEPGRPCHEQPGRAGRRCPMCVSRLGPTPAEDLG